MKIKELEDEISRLYLASKDTTDAVEKSKKLEQTIDLITKIESYKKVKNEARYSNFWISSSWFGPVLSVIAATGGIIFSYYNSKNQIESIRVDNSRKYEEFKQSKINVEDQKKIKQLEFIEKHIDVLFGKKSPAQENLVNIMKVAYGSALTNEFLQNIQTANIPNDVKENYKRLESKIIGSFVNIAIAKEEQRSTAEKLKSSLKMQSAPIQWIENVSRKPRAQIPDVVEIRYGNNVGKSDISEVEKITRNTLPDVKIKSYYESSVREDKTIQIWFSKNVQ
jgi:hypothetical protein